MDKLIFPENFLWGSACSSTQIEGEAHSHGKKENIWDFWYKKEPKAFFNMVGPEITSNFYNMYKEDIKNMSEMNLNSFRTSISWSRLIPDGNGEVNNEAVSFYNDVIDELIRNNIKPFIGLYHFDMPIKMQDIGGWESKEVVESFVRFAKICFELFGDRVEKWITFNEPIVPVEGGYLYKFHYPCVVDMKRAVTVGFNTMLAHSKAVMEFKKSNAKGEIGIVLNLTPSYPRSDDVEDVKAANYADLFFNRSFLDPAVKGEYPLELIEILKENNVLCKIEQQELDIIKNNKIDFLGVNYYQPRRIKKRETPWDKDYIMPDKFFENYEMPGRKMNIYRGWEIYEQGIYDIAINIKENYGNIPWYVSENGMGVENEDRFLNESGTIEDDYRIDFIKDHLKFLHKGIQEGSNCFGYHLWTFMDNWSWLNAYKNRYGFFSVDINNNCKRTIKKSGIWFKDVAKNNTLIL